MTLLPSHRARRTEVEARNAAIVAWIDEDQARQERNKLREQGRNEVLRALVSGALRIQNPATGDWVTVPAPWAEGDPGLFGLTVQQAADAVVSYHGLPPAEDDGFASLARFEALRAVR